MLVLTDDEIRQALDTATEKPKQEIPGPCTKEGVEMLVRAITDIFKEESAQPN